MLNRGPSGQGSAWATAASSRRSHCRSRAESHVFIVTVDPLYFGLHRSGSLGFGSSKCFEAVELI